MTTISVTREHIAKGFTRDCERCPIALAIGDAFTEAGYVSVTGLYVRVGFGKLPAEVQHELPAEVQHELPAEVQRFTWDFDLGRPVEPFTFELDYPEARPAA